MLQEREELVGHEAAHGAVQTREVEEHGRDVENERAARGVEAEAARGVGLQIRQLVLLVAAEVRERALRAIDVGDRVDEADVTAVVDLAGEDPVAIGHRAADRDGRDDGVVVLGGRADVVHSPAMTSLDGM